MNKIFRNLPPELQKEIGKKAKGFLEKVRKSAKLRAPRFSGYLASSIFVDPKGKTQWILSVEAPYAAAMETGIGLPHYVSRKKLSHWFGASRTMGPGIKAGSLPPKKGMVVVRSYKPFVQPALEHNIAQLPTMLSQGTKNAINNSRR